MSGRLCRACSGQLRSAPERVVPPGLRVRSAFVHEGAARVLVHRLKYQGIRAAATLLAAPLAQYLEPADVLVPVPRVLLRRYRFGTDQAWELAQALRALTGVTVCAGLAAPLWTPPLAGRRARTRNPPMFRSRGPWQRRWVIVDDVVTTGATLAAVCLALGQVPRLAVTATSAASGRRVSRGTNLNNR